MARFHAVVLKSVRGAWEVPARPGMWSVCLAEANPGLNVKTTLQNVGRSTDGMRAMCGRKARFRVLTAPYQLDDGFHPTTSLPDKPR